MEQSAANTLEIVNALVDAWCERRCLLALHHILQGYPLHNSLTDGWADLLRALEDVRAFASEQLTEEENQLVNELIDSIGRVVYQR